ncbi:hypothetical protein EsH8_VII_000437 [Colletotrichum jinshuiense]
MQDSEMGIDESASFSSFSLDSDEEIKGLLQSSSLRPQAYQKHSFLRSNLHITLLYVSNVCLIILLAVVTALTRQGDPALAVWSPANEAVEYVPKQHFRAALFNLTEYMGYPTTDGKTDKLWSDLYNFGISKISKEEAKKLPSPTIAIPGTEDYLIELDVWHELHCLNDLRKLLYPEVYGGLLEVTMPNGTINRDTEAFRHWDHCVDSLRQALMCHADVSPIPFHINVPANFGIFPRLATTHTCKNFTKIQQWAMDRWAGDWDFNVNETQAQELIDTSGFDNSPEEDIQFLWKLFPGNKFFKFWQEHEWVGPSKPKDGN